MRIRWWQSIHWRLILGSVLLSLFVTTMLALSAFIAIVRFYTNDEQNHLTQIARSNAHKMGVDYALSGGWYAALQPGSNTAYVRKDFPNTAMIRSDQGDDYLFFILAHNNQLAYPKLSQANAAPYALAFMQRLRFSLSHPNNTNPSMVSLHTAVSQAQQGKLSIGEVDQPYLGILPRAFVAVPITADGQGNASVVGVLVMTPRFAASDTFPPFLQAIGQSVFFTGIIVAVLAALLGIFFSQVITRPLAKLTNAARVLGRGNYSVQVSVNAPGELSELAHTFNEMAAQLNRDVEELRRQESWRRELIMSVTHDLATPLTAIAGLGEALIDGVNQSREDYEATGRIIVRETLRLRRLVKDLHVMAKVEAGALQPQRKSVRLATLVDEVLAVLIPEFERAQIEPCNAVPYNLPTLQADPDMLTRIFSNLCDNALRHTPAGGTVTIDAVEQAEMLTISVTDTGEGIPAEALPRVFERFFRADSARQSATGGSGLGLAIVRAIVEAHGGTVKAENVEGAGARIIFTLPLRVDGHIPLTDATTLPVPQKKLMHTDPVADPITRPLSKR